MGMSMFDWMLVSGRFNEYEFRWSALMGGQSGLIEQGACGQD